MKSLPWHLKLMSRKDVADSFGRSVDWLHKHEKQLRDDHGFPAPHPAVPNMFDPVAIRAWHDRLNPAAAAALADAGADDPLAKAAGFADPDNIDRTLIERAQRLAAGTAGR